MSDISVKYLNQPFDECADMKDLDAVLWEFETADIRAHRIDVSLKFWKDLQRCKHIRLKPNGDIFYKYLKINVNPDQEIDFLLY